MELQDKIKKQITELNEFISKQNDNTKSYIELLNMNISQIEDENIKCKINKMLNEAISGNIKNVQSIANSLENDLKK
jgi:hypothetical protein